MTALIIIAVFVGTFLGNLCQPWASHMGEHFWKKRTLRRYSEGTAWCKYCGAVFMGRDFAKKEKQ